MGVFKLGKMTFGSLFKKPETIKYPFETKPQPAGLKGHIELDVATCILCGMCDRSCTTNCITVDKQSKTWSIDRLQCVQCGYCITVCPKKSLSMDPNYAPASTLHERDVVQVPEQDKPASSKDKASARAKEASSKAGGQGGAKADTQDKPKRNDGASAPLPAKAKPAQGGDAELIAKVALMDPEKASRVNAALKARRS